MDFVEGMESVLHPRKDSNGSSRRIPHLGFLFVGPFDEFPQYFMDDIITPSIDYPGVGFLRPFQFEHEQMAFAQAWLYLGMLVEVLNLGRFTDQGPQFGRPFTFEDFIYQENGRHYLKTNLDAGFLSNWYFQISAMQSLFSKAPELQRIHDQRLTQLRRILETCYTFFTIHMNPMLFSELPNSSNEDHKMVHTSISVLGTFLSNWVEHIFGQRGDRHQFEWPPGLGIQDSLSGQCPANMFRMQSQYHSCVMQYIAELQWPVDDKNHSGCSKQKCIAYQLDKATYTFKKSEACLGDQCGFDGPDQNAVKDILRAGKIPVIQISSRSSSDVKMEVFPADNREYVALSHVWSDGLGNPFDNKIHRCQVLEIHHLLENLPGFKIDCIWLDTFCVPVDDEGLRGRAIKMMRYTYEKARCVLVLDYTLEKVSLGIGDCAEELDILRDGVMEIIPSANSLSNILEPDTFEIFTQLFHLFLRGRTDLRSGQRAYHVIKEAIVRVVNSPWMRRLWTYQEGRFADNLYFKFADGYIDFRLIMVYGSSGRFFMDGLFFDPVLLEHGNKLMSFHRALDHHGDNRISHEELLSVDPLAAEPDDVNLRGIFSSLAWRSTSRSKDEAVCLASILGLDPTAFMDGDQTRQSSRHLVASPLLDLRLPALPRMLLRVGRVPLSLIFESGMDIERFSLPGFHWCPRTLLNLGQEYHPSPSNIGLVPCTREGVKFNLPAWNIGVVPRKVIFQPPLRDTYTFWMQDIFHGLYRLHFNHKLSDEDLAQKLVVIVERPNLELVQTAGVNAIGAICLGTRGEVRHAKFLFRGLVRKITTQNEWVRAEPLTVAGTNERISWCLE